MNTIAKWVLVGIGAIAETGVWFWLGGPVYFAMGIVWTGFTAVWFAGPFILRAQYRMEKKPE